MTSTDPTDRGILSSYERGMDQDFRMPLHHHCYLTVQRWV